MTISKERASLYATGIQMGFWMTVFAAYCLIWPAGPQKSWHLAVFWVCLIFGIGTFVHAAWRLVQYKRQRAA